VLLPDLTPLGAIPGDDTWALMLPTLSDTAPLGSSLAAAARRLAARTPAAVTFFDPLTGHPETQPAPFARPAWVMVDLPENVYSGARIRWDGHTSRQDMP